MVLISVPPREEGGGGLGLSSLDVKSPREFLGEFLGGQKVDSMRAACPVFPSPFPSVLVP